MVSVCIPSYQRAERLRRAVERLLESSYPNLEIIVSDNASTDHTPQVCEELMRCSPRIRCFRQPTNLGPVRNFAFVRAQATGKYFLWYADDDYLDPDFIERCVSELERDISLILVAGVGAYHPGDGITRFRGNIVQADSRNAFWRTLRYIFLVEDNSIFYGVYRREQVAHCQMPNCLGGDWIWVAEALLEGRAKVLPTTYLHREISDNASVSAANIVAVLGAPPWQGAYPWLAMPLNLARSIAWKSARLSRRNVVLRAAAFATIFAASVLKQAIQVVLRRLPRGDRLYRRLFSSEVGP